MLLFAAARGRPPRRRQEGHRSRGFTLAETVVAMALCVVAMSVFYGAIARGMRIVKDAREQAMASHLIEQRFEGFRGRMFWTDVITVSGIHGLVAKNARNVGGLAAVSETYTVTPHPGQIAAISVTRLESGQITSSGQSLPLSQRSVRITAAFSWGAPPQPRRTHSVSTIFTKGGL